MDLFTAAKSVPIKLVYEKYTGGKITKKGNVSCPYHGADTHPSMRLYEHNNSFYCFTCKAYGSNIDLVKKLLNTEDIVSVAKRICQDFGVEYEENETDVDENYKRYTSLIKTVATRVSYSYGTDKNPDQNYFQKRGLSIETIQSYQLGYCPEMKWASNADLQLLEAWGLSNSKGIFPFVGRYIIPIRNSRGDVIAFAGRGYKEGAPKYINTKTTEYFDKDQILFNYDVAKHYKEVYVVEGFFDALSLIEAGIKNVVALMGTSLTQYHIENLLKDKTIILALDNDSVGQAVTRNIINEFKNVLFKVCVYDTYKDFNELLIKEGKDGVVKAVRNTITGPEFIVRYLKQNSDLKDLQNREALWIEVANLIGGEKAEYQQKYPINTNYTPVAFDYYWKIVNRLTTGRRN